jgi:hypothetical protein
MADLPSPVDTASPVDDGAYTGYAIAGPADAIGVTPARGRDDPKLAYRHGAHRQSAATWWPGAMDTVSGKRCVRGSDR